MNTVRNLIEPFFKYRWLMKQLIQRDLKLKYKRSILGYMWSLLQPLLMMSVMSIIFSKIFRYNVENFSVYLICGNVIFTLFSEATSGGMTSIINNGGLIKKVYIPKFIFPITKCMVSLVNFMYSLIAVVIILVAFKIPIGFPIVMLWFPILCTFIFSFGISMILATAATFFRDVLYLYGILLQIIMYFTPLFYPVEALPKEVAEFIWWNPLYHFILYFRNVVMYKTIPSIEEHIICISWALISVFIGMKIFKKYQKKFLMYI